MTRLEKNIKRWKLEAAKKYPIYDYFHPEPETGRVDCHLTQAYKIAAREGYVNKRILEHEKKQAA